MVAFLPATKNVEGFFGGIAGLDLRTQREQQWTHNQGEFVREFLRGILSPRTVTKSEMFQKVSKQSFHSTKRWHRSACSRGARAASLKKEAANTRLMPAKLRHQVTKHAERDSRPDQYRCKDAMQEYCYENGVLPRECL